MDKGKTFEVYRNRKKTRISEKEYIEDNLLYHSMVHNLDVVSGQIDILMDKGYFFQVLKKKANDFQQELFKHTGQQMRMMDIAGSIMFHHLSQRDYDYVSDFLKHATPAKITYLAKIIRENKDIQEMTDSKLQELIAIGEIVVEEENKGKSNEKN